MAQQTAMQTLIAWGDEMLLNQPQKLLSFGEAIDKAVELLEMEKEQIIDAILNNQNGLLRRKTIIEAEQYYNETYNK